MQGNYCYMDHFKYYSTFHFFEFYCLITNNKYKHKQNIVKLNNMDVSIIFDVLNCIKYTEAYPLVSVWYCNVNRRILKTHKSTAPIYEDIIELTNNCTKIKVNYVNDPINTVIIADKLYGHELFAYEYACIKGHVKCARYFNKNKINNYSTFRFFEFYCMLYWRHRKQEGEIKHTNNTKITYIGYMPIFLALNYIKNINTHKIMIDKSYYVHNVKWSSLYYYIYEDVEINCNTTTGIKINYIDNTLHNKIHTRMSYK